MCLHSLSRLAVSRNASGMGRGSGEGKCLDMARLWQQQLETLWCLLCTWRAAGFGGSLEVKHGEQELFVPCAFIPGYGCALQHLKLAAGFHLARIRCLQKVTHLA